MSEDDHELIAGYVLDALDPHDLERFKTHLAQCVLCAHELDSLQETAAAIAYAAGLGPKPPPTLREHLLAQIGAPMPIMPTPRLRRPRLAVAAAIALSSAALGVGGWVLAQPTSSPQRTSVAPTIAAIIADPHALTTYLNGLHGRLVIGSNRRALLIASQFPRLPGREHYEIWITASLAPRFAGLFQGGKATLILLSQQVPRGASVSVTRETTMVTAPTGPVVAHAAHAL